MKIGTLDATEQNCVKNCLFRFKATERFMLEKTKQTMQNYVMNDPSIRAAYMAEQQKKKTKWKYWYENYIDF